jgi:hypothetical protein
MTKWHFLTILLFFTTAYNSFSINFRVVYYHGIEVNDTKLIHRDFETPYEKITDDPSYEEYDITWETINKLQYINFNYTGEFLGENVSHGQKRYLVLYRDRTFAFFYDENNNLISWFLAHRIGDHVYLFDDPLHVLKATSELSEKNIIYQAGNMLDLWKLVPWAEGVNGSGIGQKIEISKVENPDEHFRYTGIALSNGFVDYNRPYLYEYNNRVKKIKVTGKNSNESIIIELEDTPHIQLFYFDFSSYQKSVEIEILEVYAGDKYNDTCINFIIPWWSDY